MAAEHPIADAVGVDVLAWMIEQYGKHPHRETLRARRREEVAALAGRGWSVTMIAGHLRVHVRAVHRIKAALASEADAAAQGRLFG